MNPLNTPLSAPPNTLDHVERERQGMLYLVPAPLDFGCDISMQMPLEEVLPQATLQVAARLQHWICENAKTTRAYLKRVSDSYPLTHELQTLHVQELPRQAHKKGDHLSTAPAGKNAATGFDAKPMLSAALATHGGHDIGLVSEAGMPAVADPGSSVVRAAHELGIRVVPLVGPVSILLALAASGLNGQNFAFVGYLPQEAAERSQRIKALEQIAMKTGQTQLFIETPYRNIALAGALLQNLSPTTRLCFASGLTMRSARIESHSVKTWRENPPELDKNLPTVFALGR